MRRESLKRLVNVGLRGLTLASKFFLILFLAKFLHPEELGIYGLLSATVSYSVYLVGFNFYNYTTRELLGSPRQEWGPMIRDQGAYFLISYALAAPLGLMFFLSGLLPWGYFIWFFMLLVLEHLGAELNRLLIVQSEQLLASLTLFMRSGLWAFFVLAAMFFFPETRTITTVFLAWVLGAGGAAIVGLAKIAPIGVEGLVKPINWGWIRRGVLVALPLLFSTLAIRSIFTFDKYLMERISGLEMLGVYTLYSGIAYAILSFMEASVFVYMYPKVVRKYKERNIEGYRSTMRRLFYQTISVAAVLSGFAVLAANATASFISNPIYSENKEIFYWLLLAANFYIVSMVPHYGLYSKSLDRPILLINLAGVVVFLAAVFLSREVLAGIAVPVAACFSFFFIFAAKVTVLLLNKDYEKDLRRGRKLA